MKPKKKKKIISISLQNRLTELEEKASQKGIKVHYDLLEAAGLKLKGGMCKINGEYHLFVDRRESISAKIDIISDCINNPLPEETPQPNG